jgi:molybdenum cofactor biosynthesis protein B
MSCAAEGVVRFVGAATGKRGAVSVAGCSVPPVTIGAPCKTRTCDLLVRSQTLYPTELRARKPRLYHPTIGNRYNRRVSDGPHRKEAAAHLRCVVLTISDTRTADTDTSGDAIARALTDAGHQIVGRRIVRDDPEAVRDMVRAEAAAAEVIITTGGTGITARDNTYEAIASLVDKRLDGFGELFRMLSYDEIGSAAMLSRACAGTIGRTAIVALPGSEPAVRLAMSKLILPEIGHVVSQLAR